MNMEGVLVLPVAVKVSVALLGGLLATILPTGVYLYVEPRSRLSWGAARAPALVRVTAWLSFALGQLVIVWLLIPAACAALLYLQSKLGIGHALGTAGTLVLAAAAIAEAMLAVSLLPLGVRLLARDGRTVGRARTHARVNSLASALVIGTTWSLGWAMTHVPGWMHPWLRAALVWTAVRPVLGFAALCMAHALLLARCVRVLEKPDSAQR